MVKNNICAPDAGPRPPADACQGVKPRKRRIVGPKLAGAKLSAGTNRRPGRISMSQGAAAGGGFSLIVTRGVAAFSAVLLLVLAALVGATAAARAVVVATMPTTAGSAVLAIGAICGAALGRGQHSKQRNDQGGG